MQATQLKSIPAGNETIAGPNQNFSVIKGRRMDEKENSTLSIAAEKNREQPQELPHFLPAPLNRYIKAPLYDFFW